jgi:hypothetical protein
MAGRADSGGARAVQHSTRTPPFDAPEPAPFVCEAFSDLGTRVLAEQRPLGAILHRSALAERISAHHFQEGVHRQIYAMAYALHRHVGWTFGIAVAEMLWGAVPSGSDDNCGWRAGERPTALEERLDDLGLTISEYVLTLEGEMRWAA